MKIVKKSPLLAITVLSALACNTAFAKAAEAPSLISAPKQPPYSLPNPNCKIAGTWLGNFYCIEVGYQCGLAGAEVSPLHCIAPNCPSGSQVNYGCGQDAFPPSSVYLSINGQNYKCVTHGCLCTNPGVPPAGQTCPTGGTAVRPEALK